MCGACGTHLVKDWSWPWSTGSRSATLIARAAERLSPLRGIRVLPTQTGWQIVLPTGATHLVQSMNALAHVARVDTALTPEIFDTGPDPTYVLDRRRTITVQQAPSDRPSTIASGTWSDTLLNPETTVVTIDVTDTTQMLHDLEELAKTAGNAPHRDHIRLLPINAQLKRRITAHEWVNLPDRIGSGGVPVLCLSIAARLVALPRTDTNFREALVHITERGTVCIQSVGATVIATEVHQIGHK